MDPLIILFIGITVLVVMIIVLRLNAFIALITCAMLVSLLSPGEISVKISRVATEFGNVVGGVGIIIAFAAIIGKCLMDSGAADKIARASLKMLGEKNASTAIMGSGFLLSIPVFFDTVFYLLVPLARSLCRKTKKNYLLYVTAIVAGGTITHTLVPPTPGPLFMAAAFGIDLGLMIFVGVLVALPSAIVGLVVCKLLDRKLKIPMREYSTMSEPVPLKEEELPSLWLSLLPIVLPVLLITSNTLAKGINAPVDFLEITGLVGHPVFALFVSMVISMYLLVSKRSLTLRQLSGKVEEALLSGGMIILVTAGGGAFGAMLRQAGLQESVASWVTVDEQGIGLSILLIAFAVASLIKFAQGSTTVALITSASMFSAMGLSNETLGFNLVYMATALGSGAMVGDWMNNSGFWIFSRMSVLTEIETLKSWTVVTACIGFCSITVTLILATLLPMT
ncbi:MAG: GntP family permease [Puniceicoccaceae bacterium]